MHGLVNDPYFVLLILFCAAVITVGATVTASRICSVAERAQKPFGASESVGGGRGKELSKETQLPQRRCRSQGHHQWEWSTRGGGRGRCPGFDKTRSLTTFLRSGLPDTRPALLRPPSSWRLCCSLCGPSGVGLLAIDTASRSILRGQNGRPKRKYPKRCGGV
jgi:hypothetical protein